jgi:trans-aconitate methyltransferase
MITLRNVAWNTSRVIAHRGGPFSRLLYSMASVYVLTYKNRNYDMTTNGEYFVLDCLSKQNIKTVFDVGANKGEYTTACLSRFLDAKIHAFEIVPATFQKLAANIRDDPGERDARRAVVARHGKTVHCDRRRGDERGPHADSAL